MRLLVHASGRHETLPGAELAAVLAATGRTWQAEGRHGRLVTGRVTRREPALAERHALGAVIGRLGFSHSVAKLRFTAPREPDALAAAARDHPPPSGSSFRVEAEYAHPGLRGQGMGRMDVERTIGQAWRGAARFARADAEHTYLAWIDAGRIAVGEEIWRRDTRAFTQRAPKERPYFSPVSGEPGLYRAVANLARVPPGGLLYDPLVGTGGILIEAALAGAHVVGSDVDAGMVQGARTNLEHAGLEAGALFVADVRDAPERFLLATSRRHADGIVTDLPYGQSATTRGSEPAAVAAWTFAAARELLPVGARLVMGAADPAWFAAAAQLDFRETERFPIRVHKSLTRVYSVFVRQGGPDRPATGLAPR